MTLNEAIAEVCGTTTIPPLLPQRAAHWSSAELRRLGALYIKAISRGVPAGATRITDKLPYAMKTKNYRADK